MTYEVVETIKGDAVSRQFETLEATLERVLTFDIESGETTDDSDIDLTPTITVEVFEDTSQWDVEYALILRVGAEPYRFVWITGDIEAFLAVSLDDIDGDLHGIEKLHVIDSADGFVEMIENTPYAASFSSAQIE